MDVTECENCGGLVVFDADAQAVQCLFCGDVSLTAASLLETVDAARSRLDALRAHGSKAAWAYRYYP